MPIVNITVAGGVSKEGKKKIAKVISDVLAEETNRPKSVIITLFNELTTEQVAIGDRILADIDKEKGRE